MTGYDSLTWRRDILPWLLCIAASLAAPMECLSSDGEGAIPPPRSTRTPVPGTVLAIGSSSMAWGLGPAFARELTDLGVEHIVNLAQTSTGLARPDFHDWHAITADAVAHHQPDLVVMHLGGNDPQPLRDRRGRRLAEWGTEAWRQAYANRVRTLLATATSHGAGVVVIGLPNMVPSDYAARVAEIDSILRRVTEERGQLYLPTWDLTSDPAGRPRLTAPIEGRERLLRRDDGIHLGKWGAPWVAAQLADRLATHLDLEATCPTSHAQR